MLLLNLTAKNGLLILKNATNCLLCVTLLIADGLAAVANMQASTRKKVLALLENPIVPIEESNSSLFGLQDDAVVTLKNKDFFTLLQYTNFEYEENYQDFVKELTENCTSKIVIRLIRQQ